MWNIVFEIFMHDVLNEYSMSDIQLARTEVAAEYVIDNERRIDIVIQNPRFLSLSKSKFMPENRRGNATTIINMRKILGLSI